MAACHDPGLVDYLEIPDASLRFARHRPDTFGAPAAAPGDRKLDPRAVMTPSEAGDVVAALEANASEPELAKVRKRLVADEPAIGVRMGELFAIAKAHAGLPLDEVAALLDHPAYEPRMAAFCILDFQVRRDLETEERRRRYDLYLRRHDRITTWDMVDRAAPRVVGGYLVCRSLEPLHRLAGDADPLRRRTAITAPLRFATSGDAPVELDESFAIASRLASDPEPVVHNAVGIFLKHAGRADPDALHRFLEANAVRMARAALRLATAKLTPTERERYRR